MNRQQKVCGFLLILALVFIIFGRDAHGAPKTIRGPQGEQTWDLMDRDQRIEFRALYDRQIGHCFDQADFAKDIAVKRDEGATEQEYLDLMRSNYEASKTGDQKPIAHHIYVDFQRMVRDIYRTDYRGYTWSVDEVWEREVWWCVF